MPRRTEHADSTSSSAGPVKSKDGRIKARAARLVLEILRRRLGYAFGGPDRDWCDPADARQERKGMGLPVSPDATLGDKDTANQRFTGCLKYANCDLIDESVRWRPWIELSEQEQETLKSVHCYRATKRRWDWNAEKWDQDKRSWDWDQEALESRRNAPGGAWIANPFGVRTDKLGDLAKQVREHKADICEHRDLSPCPIGGCVTPEMQRDYLFSLRDASGEATSAEIQPEDLWKTARVCPFFYRHTDHNLTDAVANPQRFTQCYVTLPEVRDLLLYAKFVVAAPIFRTSIRSGGLGEAFWYPFYSGFSFVQLPTRAPTDLGFKDVTLPMRWQATAAVRSQPTRVFHELPIQRVFEASERGDLVSPWESSARIVSISEGQASTFLLTWVLARRLMALCTESRESEPFNISSTLEWEYEDGKVIRRLLKRGYEVEVISLLGVEEKGKENGEKCFFRISTLLEDLKLLGICDNEGAPTERLRFCLKWIKARMAESRRAKGTGKTLGHAIREWLESGGPRVTPLLKQICNRALDHEALAGFCWVLLAAATGGSIVLPEKPDWDSLKMIEVANLSRLKETVSLLDEEAKKGAGLWRQVPPLHILVRAGWSSPLRWVFIPLGVEAVASTVEDFENNRPRVRTHSGLILMFEDSLLSLPYSVRPSPIAKNDPVLKRLELILPLLVTVASIEEAHVREDFIQGEERWQALRDTVDDARHLISNVRMDLAKVRTEESTFVVQLLANLQRRFITLPEDPRPAKDAQASIDLAKAAQAAVEDFNSYYASPHRYGVRAELELKGSNFVARIRPLEESHEGESKESVTERAEAAVELLVFEALVERFPSPLVPLTVRVIDSGASHDYLTLEFISSKPLPEWDSSSATLDFWSRGRGSYLIFSLASYLGAFEMKSAKEGSAQIVRLKLRRGEP